MGEKPSSTIPKFRVHPVLPVLFYFQELTGKFYHIVSTVHTSILDVALNCVLSYSPSPPTVTLSEFMIYRNDHLHEAAERPGLEPRICGCAKIQPPTHWINGRGSSMGDSTHFSCG
jgi:hypothetical protein